MDHNIVEVQEDNTCENTDPIGFRHHTKGMIHGENSDKLDFTEIDFFWDWSDVSAIKSSYCSPREPQVLFSVLTITVTQFQGNPVIFPDFQGHQAHTQCTHINTNILYAHKNF